MHRPEAESPALLLSRRGSGFVRGGLDAMMDRLRRRVGFRVHAHAFRHTFATVATQAGWNLERLRAAMGHGDYTVLQRYVRQASERDLGPLREWADLVVADPRLDRR
jgi:site-specific recombinase XerD